MMLHAWVTIHYFWLTDDSQVHNHIIEYQTDDELTSEVAEIYHDLQTELNGDGRLEYHTASRVKIQGTKGFAIVDLDEAFTRDQLVRMNLLDPEIEEHVSVDRKVWGKIFDFRSEQAV